jgi:hypothetical protein
MSGFLSSLKKEANIIGKEISRGAEDLGRSVGHVVDEVRSSPLLDLFKSGNVVQLISRSSGKTLQIVQAPTGQLVVDGQGPEGPEFYHAHWTVLNEGGNVVKLYNQTNYLAVINGAALVITVATSALAGPETRFRLSQTGQFITLESKKEPSRHIGILSNGQLKSALACGKENDGQFGVRLIYSPYAAGASAYPPAYPGGTVVVTTTKQ